MDLLTFEAYLHDYHRVMNDQNATLEEKLEAEEEFFQVWKEVYLDKD